MNLKQETPWNLDYFNTGEWQVVEERLNDLENQGIRICPVRSLQFEALRVLSPEDVRVAIFGQDPYPTVGDATGIPFEARRITPTLSNILRELNQTWPPNGSLRSWVQQGVFLWNVYPSCTEGKPGSHHWKEYTPLSREIVEKLDEGVVFILLGNVARGYVNCIHHSPYLETSHPAPRGVEHGFRGSNIFNRANDILVNMGKEPIDWNLTREEGGGYAQSRPNPPTEIQSKEAHQSVDDAYAGLQQDGGR